MSGLAPKVLDKVLPDMAGSHWGFYAILVMSLWKSWVVVGPSVHGSTRLRRILLFSLFLDRLIENLRLDGYSLKGTACCEKRHDAIVAEPSAR